MNSNALSVSPSPEAQIRYHALRSTQIFTIFESVLAPAKLPLVRLASDEGSALGAAVIALAGLENTCRAEQGVEGTFTVADAVAKLVQVRDSIPARPAWVEPYSRGLVAFEARLK